MKVLVVEDEWLVRELIVGELLDEGFDVVEAESGEAALARYHEHNPDVLFTDIRLPGQIDGWDVAERCRASNSELPVVYATGRSSSASSFVETCARAVHDGVRPVCAVGAAGRERDHRGYVDSYPFLAEPLALNIAAVEMNGCMSSLGPRSRPAGPPQPALLDGERAFSRPGPGTPPTDPSATRG